MEDLNEVDKAYRELHFRRQVLIDAQAKLVQAEEMVRHAEQVLSDLIANNFRIEEIKYEARCRNPR